MRRKTIWGRVCTAVLILSLLAGAVAVVFTGGRVRPPDPLPEQAQVLQPDRQERGGSGGTSDDVPLTQSPEPTEPSEEPDETETAEPSTEPDEPTDATSATQTTQTPEPSEEPTRSTGGGTEPTEEPGPAPTEAPGPEEPHIVTDLVSRVWRSGELDGDTLRFYAYAAGSGDLSLRVYYKESGSTANNGTRLLPSDDRNFSVRLTLNQSYIFSLYLYRDGRRVGDAAVYYVSYRARLADDDQPEIGDAPPVITTSRDGRTDPVSVQTMTFVVWARTGTDGSPIYTSHLQVSMDGELLTNPTGSAASGYEYVLRFSAPLVGDEREYTLRILAWDDAGNSAMRTVKIVSDKDLKVIDAIRTRTDRSAKIRWTMVTPAAPAVENDRIVLTSNGKTMYLTAAEEGGTQIVYKTFSTDPVHSYDDPNPGIYLVGFEATVPADKWATFTTTLSPGN